MTEADEKLMAIITDKLSDISFRNRVLIKPLPEIMVTTEIEEPIYEVDENGEFVKGEDGFRVWKDTKKTEKTLPSDYRKGIILALPIGFKSDDFAGAKAGTTILYPTKAAIKFDQLKDSIFIDPMNIVAIFSEKITESTDKQ